MQRDEGMIMECKLCKHSVFTCIHHGTRDVPKLNVMKCTSCGLVQLDDFEYNTKTNYESGGMLQDTYSVTADKEENLSWETWIKETSADDERRYHALEDICKGKKVLEFGCGNGGFLRRIRNVAETVMGIELMDEARKRINAEGIRTLKTLSETGEKYDVVCMFHVIEHLNDPDEILKEIYTVLSDGGKFICETCNVDCALSSVYSCKAYDDFTYWSEHVILFNSNTLEKMINRNGFITKTNTQLERYSLGNHLYWLSHGRPGGHIKWSEFNEKKLNEAYEKKLVSLGIADTLWYVGIKK